MTNFSGADGNVNGVVDQDDQAAWCANFGQTLSIGGAGKLVAAAPVATAEQPLTTTAQLAMPDYIIPNIEQEYAARPASSSSPVVRNRDLAFAAFDQQLHFVIPRTSSDARRLRASPIAGHDTNTRRADLLVTRLTLTEPDRFYGDCGQAVRTKDRSTNEAVETRREAFGHCIHNPGVCRMTPGRFYAPLRVRASVAAETYPQEGNAMMIRWVHGFALVWEFLPAWRRDCQFHSVSRRNGWSWRNKIGKN